MQPVDSVGQCQCTPALEKMKQAHAMFRGIAHAVAGAERTAWNNLAQVFREQGYEYQSHLRVLQSMSNALAMVWINDRLEAALACDQENIDADRAEAKRIADEIERMKPRGVELRADGTPWPPFDWRAEASIVQKPYVCWIPPIHCRVALLTNEQETGKKRNKKSP